MCSLVEPWACADGSQRPFRQPFRMWGAEGEPLDSNGHPKLQYSVVESLAMGMR